MHRTLLLILMLSATMLAASCQTGGPEQTTAQAEAPSDPAPASASPGKGNWPQADSTLAGIPVFSTFEEIAPVFQQDNDTTYVINFWATWCKPCVKELPYFEALHEAYEGQAVKVVLISLDFPRQLRSALLPFLEKRQLKPEVLVLLDGKYNDWIDRVDPQWSGAIPATLMYNSATGQRRFIGQAVDSVEELQTALEAVAATE